MEYDVKKCMARELNKFFDNNPKVTKKEFADLPDCYIEDWKSYKETSLPTIKDMITILSKYDSNWVVKSEDEE